MNLNRPQFSPEQAWNAALSQLRTEMPRTQFEDWFHPLRFLSFQGGTLHIQANDAYQCDFLSDRAGTKLSRLLTSYLDQPVQVRFVPGGRAAADETAFDPTASLPGGDPSPRDFPPPPEPPSPAAAISGPSVEVLLSSLRAGQVQPDQVVKLPTYYLRWLPYVGAEPVIVSMALRQERFLASNGNGSGRRVSASAGRIIQWAGISRRQYFRLLQPGSPLAWFVRKEKSGHASQNAIGASNQYLLHDLPLTPGDALDLESFLVAHGIRQDARRALQQALQTPHQHILQYPFRLPPEGFRQMKPHLLTPQGIVQRLVGQPLDEELMALADRLADHILRPAHFILITWYFLKHWLPLLGPDLAAFVIFMRSQCYDNPKTGEARHTVWLEGGSQEIADLLGIRNVRLVSDWFPAVFERGKKKEQHTPRGEVEARRKHEQQALVSQFIERTRYRGSRVGRYAWEFAVQVQDPLLPQDLALQKAAIALYHRARQQNLTPALMDWAQQVASLPPEEESALPALPAGLAEGINACFGTAQTVPDPLTNACSGTAQGEGLSASNACSGTAPGAAMPVLAPQGETNACSGTGGGILNAGFGTLLKILHQKYCEEIDSSSEMRIGEDESEPHPETAADASWDLKDLLSRSSPAKRQLLLSGERDALPFVSWVIQGAADAGCISPRGRAITCLSGSPGRGAGGAFQRLAALPPAELAALCRAALSGRMLDNPDFARLFQGKPARVQLLLDELDME